MRGKFITFEGGEGTGKSTQAAMLAQRLEALGLGVLLTREPGGSPGAEIIRHVLLSGAAKPLGPEAEAMLFAAARDDHVRCTIEPALARRQMGGLRPLRRFHAGLSGRARPRRCAADQGARAGLDRRSRARSHLILDVPVEVGLERVKRRRGDAAPDRFEAEDVGFHQKLREAFLALAADEPQRCVVIDASAAAGGGRQSRSGRR